MLYAASALPVIQYRGVASRLMPWRFSVKAATSRLG
jgi:hypothetical protein